MKIFREFQGKVLCQKLCTLFRNQNEILLNLDTISFLQNFSLFFCLEWCTEVGRQFIFMTFFGSVIKVKNLKGDTIFEHGD